MSYIQVTSEELKNRASELSGLNARLQLEIDNIVSCQVSLNAMWEGEAKDAFNIFFQKNKGTLESFRLEMDIYIQALNSIASRYEEAERRNLLTAGAAD